jgi:peptidyl-prolyl cis-trans isomerase A (cyclophilin A)
MRAAVVVVVIVASTSSVRADDPTVALFGGAVKVEVSRGWDTDVLDGPKLRAINTRQKIELRVERLGGTDRLSACTLIEDRRRELELDGWRGEEVELACGSGEYRASRTIKTSPTSVVLECSSTERIDKAAIATYRTRCKEAFNRVHFAKADDQVGAPTAADFVRYTKDIPGTGKQLFATLETSEGTIHCELFGDKAPMTVANFVGLARGRKPWSDERGGAVIRGKPYFDGLTFHRVIPDFMIQGGDPLGSGIGGPGYRFANEDNDRPMGPGALAMANAGPDTNGSQFFIMEGTRHDLEHHYTNFGQCQELDVVARIARVPRDGRDMPTSPVTIKRVTFQRK